MQPLWRRVFCQAQAGSGRACYWVHVQVDTAGLDILLVGDSVAMVVHGHDTTLPVTLDEMLTHCQAVSRGSRRFLIYAPLRFTGLAHPGQGACALKGRFAWLPQMHVLPFLSFSLGRRSPAYLHGLSCFLFGMYCNSQPKAVQQVPHAISRHARPGCSWAGQRELGRQHSLGAAWPAGHSWWETCPLGFVTLLGFDLGC